MNVKRIPLVKKIHLRPHDLFFFLKFCYLQLQVCDANVSVSRTQAKVPAFLASWHPLKAKVENCVASPNVHNKCKSKQVKFSYKTRKREDTLSAFTLVCLCVHMPLCTWGSEDSLQDSVFFFRFTDYLRIVFR